VLQTIPAAKAFSPSRCDQICRHNSAVDPFAHSFPRGRSDAIITVGLLPALNLDSAIRSAGFFEQGPRRTHDSRGGSGFERSGGQSVPS
jgi:hypothetical protein